MISSRAVAAAAKALSVEDGFTDTDWSTAPLHLRNRYYEIARGALEAALPHLLSHEREQDRLTHLDAIVNRETKRAELFQAWAEGWSEGWDACVEGQREDINPDDASE